MIDLRYHVASLIGIFLALGLGMLIGSTIVGDDLLVEQQKKMIDRLEEQYVTQRETERELISENQYLQQINNHYENYSQTLLPAIVDELLAGSRVAVVVTGGKDIPAGMVNTLTRSGAEVICKTVLLSGLDLSQEGLKDEITAYYGLPQASETETVQRMIASSVATILSREPDVNAMAFLNEKNLVKFNGNYNTNLDAVIVVGGADDLAYYYPEKVDVPLIEFLLAEGQMVIGVESTQVEMSYMNFYQGFNISTIDNIDLSPGQIALVLALEGESGNYGIKPTANKFMPTIPVEYLRRQ